MKSKDIHPNSFGVLQKVIAERKAEEKKKSRPTLYVVGGKSHKKELNV